MFSSFPTSGDLSLSNSRRFNPGRACDTCRRLKIKCQNTISKGSTQISSRTCDQCAETGSKCTYNERPAKRGRPRKKNTNSSKSRLAETLLDVDFTLPESPSIHSQSDHNSEYQSHSEGFRSEISPKGSQSNRNYTEKTFVEDISINSFNTTIDHDNSTDTLQTSIQYDDDIWNSINEFFDTSYVIFPVVSYTDLTSRLLLEPNWNSIPDFRTLLLAIRLLNATGQYRMGLQTDIYLNDIIHQVETSRLCYDFSDPATLDAVVCSLCLFTAYNVLEQHNRAFLYLDEAISLFEAVPPLNNEEEQRRRRIEQVLFNTEAATLAIYASKSKHPRARKPSTDLEYPTLQYGLGYGVQFAQVATHLLKRLTQIHLNSELNDTESKTDMELLLKTTLMQHRYSRLQAVDVLLTRQWQLSSKLAERKQKTSESIETLGIVAMSGISFLREGELRIVGLGKVIKLAQNIGILSPTKSCIIGGLTGAVMREDYERRFASELATFIMPMVSSIPPLIGSQNTMELWRNQTTDIATLSDHSDIENTVSDTTDLEDIQPCTDLEAVYQTTDFEDDLDTCVFNLE